MDISKIKQFVRENGDIFIVLDQAGEPELVVLSFQEYERLLKGGRQNNALPPNKKEETKNEPVLEETEFELPGTAGAGEGAALQNTRPFPVRLGDIRLEDLPL